MAARMVEVQVSVTVRQPKNITLSSGLLHAAVVQWARTGKAPRNMDITAIHWRKGGRDYGPYDPDAHRQEVLPILLAGQFRTVGGNRS
jgi:hypothetical protein